MENHSISRKIIVKRGIYNVAIELSDVILFYSENKVVYALLSDGSKFISEASLFRLEEKLNTHPYFRINRKCIINGDYIKSFKTHDKIRVEVVLKGPMQKDINVLVSQKRVAQFRKWVYTL